MYVFCVLFLTSNKKMPLEYVENNYIMSLEMDLHFVDKKKSFYAQILFSSGR